MDKSTSILRLQVWTERVRESHNSGMTVKDWCGQNNNNLKTSMNIQSFSIIYLRDLFQML